MTTGMLLLHGSSGVPQTARARLLRRAGIPARAIRWFGGPGQPAEPCGVAVERVAAEVTALLRRCDRVVALGTSFGAELALVLAVHDPRVSAVVAFAPSSVVWGTVVHGRQRSHWTWRGRDLPFARYVDGWRPDRDPPSYLGLYEASWAAAPPEATIPVERIDGEVVLVAGGDDHVWPSAAFAEAIRRRRGAQPTTVVTHAQAGHRALLPGERPTIGGVQMRRGGGLAADAALGAAAWPHLLRLGGAG